MHKFHKENFMYFFFIEQNAFSAHENFNCAEMGYICTYRKPIKSPIIRPDKKHIMMMIGSQLIDSFNKLKSVHTLLILSPN